jgi:hypothetical protein
VGLFNNSYKPITNTAWVRARFCVLQKGCTRFGAASDKVYQLLAHGRWFSPGTPASSTTQTGRHDIAEILLKVALKPQKSNQITILHTQASCLEMGRAIHSTLNHPQALFVDNDMCLTRSEINGFDRPTMTTTTTTTGTANTRTTKTTTTDR